MNKVVVTLQRGPAKTIDVPKEYKVGKGRKAEKREVERSCFGSVRLYPGLPKAISDSELAFIVAVRPDVRKELKVTPYVESKRADKRGCSEAQLEAAAEEAGISHLKPARKLEVLKGRGKLPAAPTKKPTPKAPAPVKALESTPKRSRKRSE